MCAVTKRGGLITWSERLGFKRQDSDSDKGWRGEIEVAGLLKAKGFIVTERATVKWPFDLLVSERVRIDVKTANYAEYGYSCGWFFRIGKVPQADVVILFEQDTKDMFILPWFYCPSSNITISPNDGKYEWYRNRFSVIENMNRSIGNLQKSLPSP